MTTLIVEYSDFIMIRFPIIVYEKNLLISMTLIIPQPQLIFTLFLFLRSLVLTLVTLKVWILNVCELFRFKIKFYVIIILPFIPSQFSICPNKETMHWQSHQTQTQCHAARSLSQSEKPAAAGQLSSPSPLLTWPASEWGVRNNRHRDTRDTHKRMMWWCAQIRWCWQHWPDLTGVSVLTTQWAPEPATSLRSLGEGI